MMTLTAARSPILDGFGFARETLFEMLDASLANQR
jgi:hypothetical protein